MTRNLLARVAVVANNIGHCCARLEHKRTLVLSSNLKLVDLKVQGIKFDVKRAAHVTTRTNPVKGPSREGDPKRGKNNASLNYCVSLVRKHDYENFLCTLLLPNTKVREGIFVVRAFNAEIAMIRDQVSRQELGVARLMFWRNALHQAFRGEESTETFALSNPVVNELSQVIAEGKLSKKWFTNLVDSREKTMSDAPFDDLSALETYCDQSVTPLLYLALELYRVKNIDVDHAASHLGKAIGLSNFIRSIPFNAQRRIVLVPRQLLSKHKLSQENFLRNNAPEKIHDLVFDIASQAHKHYETAKSLRSKIPSAARPVFLYGVPSSLFLKRLEKIGFNAYDPSLQRRQALLPLHLFLKKLSRSYF